jgi:hypothetical protein
VSVRYDFKAGLLRVGKGLRADVVKELEALLKEAAGRERGQEIPQKIARAMATVICRAGPCADRIDATAPPTCELFFARFPPVGLEPETCRS